jgi:hypothetical protein
MKTRVIVRKETKNIPKLARNKDLNLYSDFTKEELKVLINNKRKDCCYVSDELNYQKIRTEIRLLEDLYSIEIIDGVEVFNKYRDENKEVFFTNDLGIESNCILTRMGYKIPLYTEECIKISDRIDDGDILDDIRQTVALAIVKEILEFYGAKFDEQKLLNDYKIDEKKFYDYYLSIHKWCKKNHWKDN